MGVKMVAGTDTSYFDKNNRTMADEIIELSDAGMEPMNAIKAGTSVSAEELGVDKRTGSIRVGYEADFVVIDRSPLENIRHIGDVVMVVNNGHRAKPAECRATSLGGTGFSLWDLLLVMTKNHRLKPVPLGIFWCLIACKKSVSAVCYCPLLDMKRKTK